MRHNIAFGSANGHDHSARVVVAAAKNGVMSFVTTLLEGLDTPLGKTYYDGTELSVGQWQKIAIVRAGDILCRCVRQGTLLTTCFGKWPK